MNLHHFRIRAFFIIKLHIGLFFIHARYKTIIFLGMSWRIFYFSNNFSRKCPFALQRLFLPHCFLQSVVLYFCRLVIVFEILDIFFYFLVDKSYALVIRFARFQVMSDLVAVPMKKYTLASLNHFYGFHPEFVKSLLLQGIKVFMIVMPMAIMWKDFWIPFDPVSDPVHKIIDFSLMLELL